MSGWNRANYNGQQLKTSGGNTGGYLQGQSWGATLWFDNRKPEFTGDYAAKGWRQFRFDLKRIDGAMLTPVLRVRSSWSDGGWSYLVKTFNAAWTSWQTAVVPFNPAWTDSQAVANGWAKGSQASTFATTLRNVRAVLIEFPAGYEVYGLDNFQLGDALGVGPADRWEPPRNGWTPPDVTASVNAKTPGGKPDGYLESQGADVGFFSSNPDHTGDYSLTGWHALSFDLFGWGHSYAMPELNIRGADPSSGWSYPLRSFVQSDTWQHISILFNPSWTDEAAVSSGWFKHDPAAPSFAATLREVHGIGIRFYTTTDGATAGLDNFSFGSSCQPPIP